MKKIIALLLAAAAITTAHAQKQEQPLAQAMKQVKKSDKLNIMLDTRVDARIRADERGFAAHTFKLWLAGEIYPGIRYRVRHRLNRPATPLREGFSAATDHAWVAFDLGANRQWTIMAGKQSVQFGTFEYDYNPADIYLPTMCFDDLDAYKTGVNVAYRFAEQVLNLQIVNSDSPQFASGAWTKKALALNVLWEGSLWDGALRTRWAYGAFQHDGKRIYGWYTAGLQGNVGNFTAELDGYAGRRVMNNQQVNDRSASLNIKYNFGKLRPQLKGTWNRRQPVGDRENTWEVEEAGARQRTWGIQAAAEYFPFTQPLLRDLRLHAAYIYNKTRGGVSPHTALIGMRWLLKAM